MGIMAALPIPIGYGIAKKRLSIAKEKYNKFRIEQTESLRKEEQLKPRQYHRTKDKESTDEKIVSVLENILIFVSYATKDADLFKIKEVANALTAHNDIKDVLYWQEDMKDNIIEYMDHNLGRCDIMLLFCSPNAIDSIPVKKEWTAADSMNLPIIPVFTNTKYIPPLLSSRLGTEFDPFDVQKNVEEIYKLIIKKLS
jgi:hypothetical protein